MTVSEIKIVSHLEYCQLQAQVDMATLGGKRFVLWYRFPLELEHLINSYLGDPFVAALLLPTMITGEQLQIEAPVSQKLFTTLSTIQDIYRCWNKSLKKIIVTAPIIEKTLYNEVRHLKTASFFSGGVDSFYTLLKHVDKEIEQEENNIINSLILVHGFDIRISKENDRIFKETLSGTQKVGGDWVKKYCPYLRILGNLLIFL